VNPCIMISLGETRENLGGMSVINESKEISKRFLG